MWRARSDASEGDGFGDAVGVGKRGPAAPRAGALEDLGMVVDELGAGDDAHGDGDGPDAEGPALVRAAARQHVESALGDRVRRLDPGAADVGRRSCCTFTITPPPASRMSGITARHRYQGPERFTRTHQSQCSGS